MDIYNIYLYPISTKTIVKRMEKKPHQDCFFFSNLLSPDRGSSSYMSLPSSHKKIVEVAGLYNSPVIIPALSNLDDP
jgi:hypothetical protein